MSRDIDVVPFRDVRIGLLLERTGQVARTVLNLSTQIELDVRRIEHGVERSMGGDDVFSTGESCVVSFNGELPACMTSYVVPEHVGMPPEDRLPHVGISVFGRSPARFVTAPIVAIALADLLGAVLLGDSNLDDWFEEVRPEDRVSPADFLDAIKLVGPQPSLKAAITAFCSMTKSGRGHLGR